MSMATEVKARPIIFSAPMVRAILAGAKTQTRRVVKPEPQHWQWMVAFDDGTFARVGEDFETNPFTSPLGQPGDRLWVRESIYVDHINYVHGPLPNARPADVDDMLYYRADGECCQQIPECSCAEIGKPKWRSARFMPKWAARIWLEIIAVRVEQLQDIDQWGAYAEGVSKSKSEVPNPVANYRALWDSINGKSHPWSTNPWVWAIEFKRMEAT